MLTTDLGAGEHRLLDLYADLGALTPPRRDEPERELLRSPQEYLNAYLRSLDAERRGTARALRGAAHGRSPTTASRASTARRALEDACHRLFLSQQRAAAARAAVLAILDRRLEQADDRPDAARLREALVRLEAATEGRDQVIADLAREPRFRYFDEPLIAARPRRGLRRHGGAPAPRWPRTRSAPTATSASRALVACPRVWRRC